MPSPTFNGVQLMDLRFLRPAIFSLAVVSLLTSTFSQGAAVPTSTVSYSGQKVVRLQVGNPEDLDLIRRLSVDVWNCFGPGIGTFEARATPQQLKKLSDAQIPFEVIADVQELVDAERQNIARGAENGDWFQNFHNLQDINDRIGALAQQYPSLTELRVIGRTIEGRDIKVLRITGPATKSNPREARPAFVFDGTQHAREWIAPMTVMFAVEQLLSRYEGDPRVSAVVDGVDFYVVPMVNPDGYDYTWTGDRYWRKNRRINGGTCDLSPSMGVDLNRNWSVGWGGEGSSSDTCSEVYHGVNSWSEPEVVALRDLIRDVSVRVGGLGAYLDFHSFGQLVLSPWMYTLTPPPDAQHLNNYGALISDAIFGVSGRRYRSGQGSQILYIAAGAAQDWIYGDLGADGWGIELRGDDFQLPPSEIIPTGAENLEGILQLSEVLLLGG